MLWKRRRRYTRKRCFIFSLVGIAIIHSTARIAKGWRYGRIRSRNGGMKSQKAEGLQSRPDAGDVGKSRKLRRRFSAPRQSQDMKRRTTEPPEKLDAQTVDSQQSMPFQFLTSLPRFRSGWFANKALQRTWPSRLGCNPCILAARSLSFRR